MLYTNGQKLHAYLSVIYNYCMHCNICMHVLCIFYSINCIDRSITTRLLIVLACAYLSVLAASECGFRKFCERCMKTYKSPVREKVNTKQIRVIIRVLFKELRFSRQSPACLKNPQFSKGLWLTMKRSCKRQRARIPPIR